MPRKPWLVLALSLLVVAAAEPVAAQCGSDLETLCLLEGRFAVSVEWRTPRGREGDGRAVPLTDQTGVFWFFNDQSYEVMVKILDGRQVNGRFWVFLGSLSNVEYTVTVRDTRTQAVETYYNPPGHLYGLADVQAFPGGEGEVCGGIAGLGCAEGLFCEYPPGTCGFADQQGVCTRPPESCPEIFEPVCGCDGETYANDCFRQMARVALDHTGPC